MRNLLAALFLASLPFMVGCELTEQITEEVVETIEAEAAEQILEEIDEEVIESSEDLLAIFDEYEEGCFTNPFEAGVWDLIDVQFDGCVNTGDIKSSDPNVLQMEGCVALEFRHPEKFSAEGQLAIDIPLLKEATVTYVGDDDRFHGQSIDFDKGNYFDQEKICLPQEGDNFSFSLAGLVVEDDGDQYLFVGELNQDQTVLSGKFYYEMTLEGEEPDMVEVATLELPFLVSWDESRAYYTAPTTP